MAKITCVIDIGSNSTRMSIFKKTSRFSFHIMKEFKSMTKVSSGSYSNNGFLQEDSMQKTIEVISSFSSIAKSYKSNKILAIATMAVRNAPNKDEFKQRIKQATGISIKIIDGDKEAVLGAIGVINLLPLENGIIIDTGGGSTEISIVQNSNIIRTKSVDLGCVNMKELFFDKGDITGCTKHIQNTIKDIENIDNLETAILVGGSGRSFSKILLDKSESIPLMHGFSYSMNELSILKDTLQYADNDSLLKMGVARDRLETTNPAILVIYEVLKKLSIKHIMVSSVGVREGLFLSDMLRGSNYKFPSNFNIGIRSIRDQFVHEEKSLVFAKNISFKLFDVFQDKHNLDNSQKKYLYYALVFLHSESFINLTKKRQHSRYVLLNKRIFGLSHQEKALLSVVIRYTGYKMIEKKHIAKLYNLVDYDKAYWICLLLSISINISLDSTKKIEISLSGKTLKLKSDKNLILEKQSVDKVNFNGDIEFDWN